MNFLAVAQHRGSVFAPLPLSTTKNLYLIPGPGLSAVCIFYQRLCVRVCFVPTFPTHARQGDWKLKIAHRYECECEWLLICDVQPVRGFQGLPTKRYWRGCRTLRPWEGISKDNDWIRKQDEYAQQILAKQMNSFNVMYSTLKMFLWAHDDYLLFISPLYVCAHLWVSAHTLESVCSVGIWASFLTWGITNIWDLVPILKLQRSF